MTQEREHNNSVLKPPSWWHEAIRNNIPGNLIGPEEFASFTERTPDGISYTILSVTKDTGLTPEGIYILTDIPINMVPEDQSVFMPLILKVAALISSERINHDPEIVIPPDPRLAELGRTANIASSIKVNSGNSAGRLLFSLVPVTPEEMFSAHEFNKGFDVYKRDIVSKYFELFSDAERIRLLFDESLPNALKKEILRMELRSMKGYVALESALFELTDKEREDIASDLETQDFYLSILNEIGRHKTPEEGKHLIKIVQDLEPKIFVGWLDFYRKYWEDKFGPLD